MYVCQYWISVTERAWVRNPVPAEWPSTQRFQCSWRLAVFRPSPTRDFRTRRFAFRSLALALSVPGLLAQCLPYAVEPEFMVPRHFCDVVLQSINSLLAIVGILPAQSEPHIGRAISMSVE